jgi:predicted amidohydrolase YtcJ
MLLDMYERVARDNGPRDRRFRVEHAQHLRPVDIGRFGRDQVVASMQPYHAIDDGRWAAKRLDARRLKGTYAFRALLDAGAPLAFGSDWTVAPIEPLLGIYAAVTRRTLDDKNPDGWIPEQKISVEEALRAYTSGAAYAGFEENVKGRLAAGFVADFVVLSDDLFAIDPVAIRDVKVLETVSGGREVYSQ